MTAEYKFNRQFRERIIALCLEPDWFGRYGVELIKPEYFELEVERDVVGAILDFYAKYERAPARDELVACLGNDPNGDTERIYAFTEDDLTYAADKAVQFAQEQAMKLAILDSVDDIEAGDLSSPSVRVREAQKVGQDLKDIGINLKEDSKWAYDEVLGDKIQTGIMHLDLMLDGGLANGELGIVLAGTNVGKTLALVNFGCGAANILGRCNVAHVTLELAAKKVAKRYAARTTFRWLTKEDDPGQYLMEFRDAAGRTMPGSVYIREWPTGVATTEDIEAYLEKLKYANVGIQLLIVDYPGEMRHKQIGEYRHNLGNTIAELRGLAGRWDIPTWAALQTNRGALSKALVTIQDMGETFEPAQKADVILALCQTDIEKEEDLIRLFAAKIRDGATGWMVRCHIDAEAHALISDEIITVGQLMKEIKQQREDGRR